MCQASSAVYSSELAAQGCGLDEDQPQHWLSIIKGNTTEGYNRCDYRLQKNIREVKIVGKRLLSFCKTANKGASQANYAD